MARSRALQRRGCLAREGRKGCSICGASNLSWWPTSVPVTGRWVGQLTATGAGSCWVRWTMGVGRSGIARYSSDEAASTLPTSAQVHGMPAAPTRAGRVKLLTSPPAVRLRAALLRGDVLVEQLVVEGAAGAAHEVHHDERGSCRGDGPCGRQRQVGRRLCQGAGHRAATGAAADEPRQAWGRGRAGRPGTLR